jgi:hypothetical protein
MILGPLFVSARQLFFSTAATLETLHSCEQDRDVAFCDSPGLYRTVVMFLKNSFNCHGNYARQVKTEILCKVEGNLLPQASFSSIERSERIQNIR